MTEGCVLRAPGLSTRSCSSRSSTTPRVRRHRRRSVSSASSSVKMTARPSTSPTPSPFVSPPAYSSEQRALELTRPRCVPPPPALVRRPQVPFEEDDRDPKTWFLDLDYVEGMWEMFRKVNGAFPA